MRPVLAQSYRFDDVVVDPWAFRVIKAGKSVDLEPKALSVLVFLIENRGRLVDKRELIQAVWGDTFVTDNVLSRAIAQLRKGLADDAKDARYIETVPTRGYRFVAEVSVAGAAPDSGGWLSGPRSSPVAVALRRSRYTPLVYGVLLTLVVAAAWTLYHWRGGSRSQAGQIHSLAVLPLTNLSGDPAQEYFADGMTDEVTTILAKSSSLRVVSRTSAMQYKGAHRPLRDIARELGVDGVVEGSVTRSGDNVRVTAQLIYAPTDTHLWAEHYERKVKDMLLLERELAQTIAERVNARFTSATQPLKQTNPDAHDAYLRGRFAWFGDSRFDQAREFFQKAIDIQPDYAAAWSGLADSFIVPAVSGRADPKLTRMKAEPMARKALELDESSPEAHNTMAAIHLFFDWDWRAADEEAQRAIALNPNYAEAHHLRSYVLQAMNRLDESVEEAKQAIALDPASRPWGLGYALLLDHKFDAAVVELQQRSEARPTDLELHYFLEAAYRFKGMDKESVAELMRALELEGDHASVAEVKKAFENEAYPGVAKWRLHRWQKEAKTGYVSSDRFAEAYADLRDRELTLRYLELAYRERSPRMVRVHLNPSFDFLHSDPRFQSILKRVGLSPAF